MNFHIDADKLTTVLKHFYTLTHLRTCVFDDKFQIFASYPGDLSRFCNTLRQFPEAEEKCKLCDQEACRKCKQQKTRIQYRCHAGLSEIVVPIQQDNVIIGYVMFGQFLQTEDYDASWAEIEPYLKTFSVNIEALKSAYFKKEIWNDSRIDAAATMLEMCAAYLHLSKVFSLRESSLAHKINEYINQHLHQDLSVTRLCDVFGISKSRLYEISEHSYSKSIAQYIRDLRINRAKKLLAESNKKISEVAEECGFTDYNYFTKVFRKSTGFTPREFKKHHNQKTEMENRLV